MIFHIYGKSRFAVVCETQFILILLFINYCIIFHRNNCKPTFVPPCVCVCVCTHVKSPQVTTALKL